jgi:SAM-dependent methyltransferase
VEKIKDMKAIAGTLVKTDGLPPEHAKMAQKLFNWFSKAHDIEIGDKNKIGFRDYLRNDFVKTLHKAGIKSGRICEIGGPYNSFAKQMPDYDFEFMSLYPDKHFDNIIVADATQCEQINDNTFDAVLSVSVFEHISKPWKAARNMNRILKPGGLSYHAAPFSYFYHGAPADFWRYTPDAMKLIFSELKPLKAEFYGKNRRRDNRGSKLNAVDRDGGIEFSLDAFGGWRENWFTIYAGQKNPTYLEEQIKTCEMQVVVNLMKHFEQVGLNETTAAENVQNILSRVIIDHDEEIIHTKEGTGLNYSLNEITEIWQRRGRNGIRPSYSRHCTAARLKL